MWKRTPQSSRRTTLPVVLALILSACGTAATVSQTTVLTSTSTSTTSTTTTTTTVPPTTSTTTAPPRFPTVAGTPPHSLESYTSTLSIAMTLPGSTIEVVGSGVYTSGAFSCEWETNVLGETNSNLVLGSPTTVWLGGPDGPAYPPASQEAISAQWLCPSSAAFWPELGALPDGGESEMKNGVPSRRVVLSEPIAGIPGMQFGNLDGVSVEQVTLWAAEPGDWVSAIEIVMTVGPDAATSIWNIPFDPGAEPTEMIYEVGVANPDDPDLEVSLPEAVDFELGFGAVAIDGEPLPFFESGELDTAVQTKAPTVTGEDWNGSPTTITADGRAKIILFLAHWCPHCRDEVSEINQWLAEGSLPDEVDMYSVTVMTDYNKSNWPPQNWLMEADWRLPLIMDDGASSAARAFGVVSVPFYVVLDGDNSTILRVSGGIGVAGLNALVDIALGG